MTPLFFAIVLIQTAPAPAAVPALLASPNTPGQSATVAPPLAEPAPSAEDTYQGLQQVYSATCGQTGILYHAYDEICDSLRKQIKTYRDKVDRDQAQAARGGAQALRLREPSLSRNRGADAPRRAAEDPRRSPTGC